jgi:alpha-D-xyloside xylohydrolase
MQKKARPNDAPPRYSWIVSAREWQVEDDTLIVTLQTESGQRAAIRFRAEHPAVWRIAFFPPGLAPEFREPVAAQPVLTPVPLAVEKTERGLRVTGPELALDLDFEPWAMRFRDGSGKEIFGENPADVDGLGRPFILPLGYVTGQAKVVGKPQVAAVVESFRLHPGEHLYGLGEKFGPLNKVGQRVVSWNRDALGSTTERSHKNIPFVWSDRGYGLFIDTGARITWELGTASCQSAQIQVEEEILDAYLIYGPAPARIIDHYAGLTGRASLPPIWTFGLRLSTGGTYRTQADVANLIIGLEKHELPADAIHIDTWWMRDRRYCDFEWNREAFPRPKELIESIHRRGLKLTLWEQPYISVESELFKVGKENSYFVRRPDGEVYIIDYGLSLAPRPDGAVRFASSEDAWNAPVAIVDFTNPEAAGWFKHLHKLLLDMGVDAFNTDFGEDVPEDAVFADGRTGAVMHNIYPLLYNRAVFDATRDEKGSASVWARSAFAGSQQYPVNWSGDPASDFESLACSVRGGLSAGLSGLPFWSSDTGGYRGMPSPELYVRWAQFGLFCSHIRMHGDSPREPWHFGDEAMAIVRKYVILRYELFPYIYSAAFEASLKGIPVIRALPLVFPEDPNVHDKDFEFMFGPSILVAPVVEPGIKHRVYLPEGSWFNYWTGKPFKGPKNLALDVPLDILPLYVRGGAIVPKMQRAWRIPEERIDPLIVEVWPQGSSSHRLYEDDGVTEFSCVQGREAIDFEWSGPVSRRIILHFKGIKPPKRITFVAREEPDEVHQLEGMKLAKTYVLALPETSSARVKLTYRV